MLTSLLWRTPRATTARRRSKRPYRLRKLLAVDGALTLGAAQCGCRPGGTFGVAARLDRTPPDVEESPVIAVTSSASKRRRRGHCRCATGCRRASHAPCSRADRRSRRIAAARLLYQRGSTTSAEAIYRAVERRADRLGLGRGLAAEDDRQQLPAAAVRRERTRGIAELALAYHQPPVDGLGEVVELERALVERARRREILLRLQRLSPREHGAREPRLQPVAQRQRPRRRRFESEEVTAIAGECRLDVGRRPRRARARTPIRRARRRGR